MYYSHGLEHIVRNYCPNNCYGNVAYFSKNVDDNPYSERENLVIFEPEYLRTTIAMPYAAQQKSTSAYATSHSFTPEIFLMPSRPKSRFIDDSDDARKIAEEVFEVMSKQKLPETISISILPFGEFRALHSGFGSWSNGILGFSVNGAEKKIFVRENRLDALMIVIGHEIGHVLTETLPNKHDEEAKAFAFSAEWAKTIKEHDIAGLGANIKDETDFQPARNGLHDAAFAFVDFMLKRGRKAMQLHDDLAKKYMSVFNSFYYPK